MNSCHHLPPSKCTIVAVGVSSMSLDILLISIREILRPVNEEKFEKILA